MFGVVESFFVWARMWRHFNWRIHSGIDINLAGGRDNYYLIWLWMGKEEIWQLGLQGEGHLTWAWRTQSDILFFSVTTTVPGMSSMLLQVSGWLSFFISLTRLPDVVIKVFVTSSFFVGYYSQDHPHLSWNCRLEQKHFYFLSFFHRHCFNLHRVFLLLVPP